MCTFIPNPRVDRFQHPWIETRDLLLQIFSGVATVKKCLRKLYYLTLGYFQYERKQKN